MSPDEWEEEEGANASSQLVAWHIDPSEAGERIDKVVSDRLGSDFSRTQVQQWIKDGLLKIDGHVVKANYRPASGQQAELFVPPPAATEILPENIPLDIVYEDADVIVVNKPRGMVVHPAPGHYAGTLVNALLYHCRDLSGINGALRPGIVHRIDKDTSGLIMAAKNDRAHRGLAGQLQEHSVTRIYTALVHGNVVHDTGTVDAPIGRDPRDRKLFTVIAENSKEAITHFTVIERFPGYTLLQLRLKTGRTHQIRVHMQFIGHPLVGDPQYGKKGGITMNGQALHAGVLGFRHPRTAAYLEFRAPLPQDMEHILQRLRSL
ncbi:MAG TPA: RluA family pseudouridine synthase [Bacilli bacterium]